MGSFPARFPTKTLHEFHMPAPIAVSWSYRPNTVSWAVRSMLLVITRHFLPLGSKYLSQHLIIECSWPKSSINVTRPSWRLHLLSTKIISTTLVTGSMVPRLQTKGLATVQMTAVRASPLAYVNQLKVLVEYSNILEHELCSLACNFSCFKEVC